MGYKRENTAVLEWTAIFSVVLAAILTAVELVGYSRVRQRLPEGMTIADVPVGSMTTEEAAAELQRIYSAPLELYYDDATFTLDPAAISFRLDLEVMLARADTYRTETSWWWGFFMYLMRRPSQSASVQLVAQYSTPQLETYLEDVAARYDRPPTDPVGVTGTLDYVPGDPGFYLDILSSQAVIDAALQSPFNRRAVLTVRSSEAPPPTLATLRELLVAQMDRAQFPGVYSIVVVDLETGEEISINPDVAYAGMSMMKIPLILELYRQLNTAPLPDTDKLINETIIESGNFTANLLLDQIGDGNRSDGVRQLTTQVQALGLVNTFMAAPYDQAGPYPRINTPANQRTDLYTEPDPAMQTSPGDMAALLTMIYQCEHHNNGALRLLYGNEVTQEECKAILDLLKQNDIDILIETGLPEGTEFAHKHGFAAADTHGDGGIVYSPSGDYVIVVYLYKPVALEWELSSPIFTDISRAVYAYFNP